ncbi:MAG: type II secretion system protein J [Chthoniobacteraceae bacterium]
MKGKLSSAESAKGFTLVEVLVSIAIFILLITMVSQLTNDATTTTANSGKRLDAESQARMIFDRMANDFARMVKRTDVDYLFAKQTANDALFFYSEAPAYFDGTASGAGTVALIGYRINSSLQLERLGKGLSWAGAAGTGTRGSPVFFVYPDNQAVPDSSSTIAGNWSSIGTSSRNYADGADTDYHVLANQAYRLEISFVLSDGTISTKPILDPTTARNNLSAASAPTLSSDQAQGYAPGSRWYDTASGRGYYCVSAAKGAAVWNPVGIKDITGIIVGIAILDRNSLKIVSDTSKMVSALPDAVDGEPISRIWNDSDYLTQSGIPKAAAGQLRVYQRIFYLNK